MGSHLLTWVYTANLMPEDQQSGVRLEAREEDDPERKRKPLKTSHRMQTTKEFSQFLSSVRAFKGERNADKRSRVLADLTTLSRRFSNFANPILRSGWESV